MQLHAGMNRVSVPFTIDHPELWWCRGMGEPHLYTFRTSVELGGRVLAGHSAQVGLRPSPSKEARRLRTQPAVPAQRRTRFLQGRQLHPCDCFRPASPARPTNARSGTRSTST
ncbi:MAG: hypothetical protein ACLRM8_00635 [Alistipes sp.]